MKFILKILFAVMVLVFIAVITGLFLPKQVKIVRTKVIKVPRQIVYEQIFDFRNWKNWSPWLELDSTLAITYNDFTSGQGANAIWSSNYFGDCELTITHAVFPESMAVDFNFGTKSKTILLWYIEPQSDGCLFNWTLNITKLSFLERYFAFFQKNKLADLVQLGIDNIEQRCIQLKYSRTSAISTIDMPAIPIVVLFDSVKPELVQEKLKKDDAYLLRFFERRDLKPAGKPFKMLVGIVNDTLVKYGYGYPLEERTWVWKTLNLLQFPEGKVLTVSHFGRQRNIETAHIALKEFIELNGLEQNGTPWEVYLFDSEIDTDTSLWETLVYFPIK